MSSSQDKTNDRRFIRCLPLRSVLIVPFVLQIFAAVGLTGYLSLRNGKESVNNVSSQLRQEMSSRINLQVSTYLEKPYIVGQTIAIAAEENQLDLTDITKLERTFWRLVDQDTVKFVQIALEDGSSIGVEESIDPKINDRYLMVNVGDKANLPRRETYKFNDRGERTTLLRTLDKFDPRTRPWYVAAKKAGKPTWIAQPFMGKSQRSPGIAITQPIYKGDGTLLGVVNNILWVDKIHNFLQELKIGQTGQTFIIDRSGNLIASSTIAQPYIMDDKKGDLQQIPAVKSESPIIRATAQAILNQTESLDRISQNQQLDFMLDGQKQFVQVSTIRDERGIDWLSVIVVPESDFMGQINDNTRTTILLCLAALGLASILGIYTSRWISQPILKLQQASESIAAGELDRTVEVNRINELEGLGRSFNQMATQLKSSFTVLEDRVAERTSELQRSRESAENANQAKSEFLANMSHELRTPLNGILGYAQIMQRSKVLPEKERHGVNIIHQCGTHLLTLINDVLDLAKIEARKLELAPQAVHLPSFLQGIVEICSIRAEQKDIAFHYEPDADLPAGIVVDEKRLRQVLLNLIGNAIKFTDRGHVTLRVENTSVKDDRTTLRFTVADTGVGVMPEDAKKLFHAFEQVGEQHRKTEGTGLGLAISQQIVQLMDGHIQLKSQPEVGSDFYFEVALPLAANWSQQQTATLGNIMGYEGERRHILVVDDRWENRAVLLNLLEPIGFTVTEAENGAVGLEKMRQNRPDLVIADLAMPVMDGFEMLKQLRCDSDLQSLKVLVSSASVAQLDQQMSLDAGGDDFLTKPVQVTDLFKLIEKHLDLTWQLEESPPEATSAQPTALISPPTTEIQAWLDLVQGGRLKKLITLAQQFAQQDDRYQPYVQQVVQLAQQFQSEQLEQLLQQSLNELNLIET